MWLLDELLPEEFLQHKRAARRERLLGWRALIDGAIERLDQRAAQPGAEASPRAPRHEFWAHRRAARREEMLACRSLLTACLHDARGRRHKHAQAEAPARIEVV
jgi:hypothetical protein